MSTLDLPHPVTVAAATQYRRGECCDGRHLLQQPDLSVIRERMPAGASEVRHFHRHARQFFLLLSGEAVMAFADGRVPLIAGQGIEIPPELSHRFCNESTKDVESLVISAPAAHDDRVVDDAAPEEAGP